ncbi:MAG: pantetheine-phosphate adenylyltransferase [Defluviitaleaceae bacterium]|nr:pantetheine-phosphate adenylyltransferase [Defluviitaleaceae bacterium]
MPIHAVYPGSFDPATYGHLDIIGRASRMIGPEGRLTVAVLDNSEKMPLLSVSERTNCLRVLTKEFGNVDIASFSGLLTDFAQANGINVIIRGIRTAADFEYENTISQVYRSLYDGAETIYIPAESRFAYISSSIVKEVAMRGGAVGHMAPPAVAEILIDKYRRGN